jgi:hypothetical protein
MKARLQGEARCANPLPGEDAPLSAALPVPLYLPPPFIGSLTAW